MIHFTLESPLPDTSKMVSSYLAHGGAIVEYKRVWSLGVVTKTIPVLEWIAPGRSRRSAGIKHAAFCFAFGWWAPVGLLGTLPVIFNNLLGGLNVTEVLAPPPLADMRASPVPSVMYKEEQRQKFITSAGIAAVIAALIYLAYRTSG